MATILGPDESLFKAPGALKQEYLPRELPYREHKLKHLSHAIKEASSKPSIYIWGAPGVGKTASIRWVFRKLEESSEKIFPLYINCWENSSSQSIYSKLRKDFKISRIGKDQQELQEAVLRKLSSYKGIAVAFDEADRLKDHDFLYSFLNEIQARTTFLITTKRGWLANLDERIRSRLLPEQLHFKHYSLDETKEILQYRARYAFVKGVWSSEAFDLVVKKCHKSHDIRVGLFLLQEAGRNAELDASRKIELQHARNASEKIKQGTLANF